MAIVVCQTRIGCHVYSCSSYRPRTYAATHTVAYLTTSTGSRTIERLYRGWEIVGLGLERDDALYVLHLEPVGS